MTRWYQRIPVPHVFVLLTLITFIASLLTYVVPAGSYERRTVIVKGQERTLVVPGTYHGIPRHYSLRGLLIGDDPSANPAAETKTQTEGDATAKSDGTDGNKGILSADDQQSTSTTTVYSAPVSLHGFLTAIPRGLENSADIIFFIFIIGGAFGILQRSGTIPAAIGFLLKHFGHSPALVTITVMVTLAAGGSTLGMGEEFIPLVPVFLLLSQRLGYDRLFGLSLVFLAAEMGFASATTNPFTVNIAQGIAELKLNSGMGLRIAFFVCSMTLTIRHVLRHAARIRSQTINTPEPPASACATSSGPSELRTSVRAEAPQQSGKQVSTHAVIHDKSRRQTPTSALDDHILNRRHLITIITCVAIFGLILYGVANMGWAMSDMAGGFFLMGIIAAAATRLSVAVSTSAFVKGMEDMVVAALVVGFARGIRVVLDDGMILDTVIYAAASTLESVPKHVSVVGMLIFQTSLNFFIPSGSGQAVVTMPIMAPLADVLGLTRQTAVLAFQFGDGLSNLVIPTSGILMAMLSLAKIPYGQWLRFVLPLFLQVFALAAVFLIIAVSIGYS